MRSRMTRAAMAAGAAMTAMETVRANRPDRCRLYRPCHPSLDAQRPHLPRCRILRPQHDPHGVRVDIDIPARDARPHKLRAVIGREPFGRGIEELHQLHPPLEIGTAFTARRDANTHIVIEL